MPAAVEEIGRSRGRCSLVVGKCSAVGSPAMAGRMGKRNSMSQTEFRFLTVT